MHYVREEKEHFLLAKADTKSKTVSMPKSSRVEKMTGRSVSPWCSLGEHNKAQDYFTNPPDDEVNKY